MSRGHQIPKPKVHANICIICGVAFQCVQKRRKTCGDRCRQRLAQGSGETVLYRITRENNRLRRELARLQAVVPGS